MQLTRAKAQTIWATLWCAGTKAKERQGRWPTPGSSSTRYGATWTHTVFHPEFLRNTQAIKFSVRWTGPKCLKGQVKSVMCYKPWRSLISWKIGEDFKGSVIKIDFGYPKRFCHNFFSPNTNWTSLICVTMASQGGSESVENKGGTQWERSEK